MIQIKELVALKNDKTLSPKEKVEFLVKNIKDTWMLRLVLEEETGEPNLEFIAFSIGEIANEFYKIDYNENPCKIVMDAFDEIIENLTPLEREIFYRLISMARNYIFSFFVIPSLNEDKVHTNKCVYILEMDNDTVKIGVTADLNKRTRNIMNSSGAKILRQCRTNYMSKSDALKIEDACHKALEKYRLKGEFFKITFEEACEELKKYVDIEGA